MITLIKKIIGNVAGAIGDITFSNWNDQTIINTKSEGLNSLAFSNIRSVGIFAFVNGK